MKSENNKNKLTLTIRDEVNVRFEGLTSPDIKQIIKDTALTVKGAFQTAAFKTKIWDGKESQFQPNGSTFEFMLDKVSASLVGLGYSLDNIEIRDLRPLRNPPTFEPITDDYLSEYGITLRYFQTEGVNIALTQFKGVIEAATAAGKCLIAATIGRVVLGKMRLLIIVHNQNLCNDMVNWFEKIDVPVGVVSGDQNAGQKKRAWDSGHHIVTTWQTLARNRKYLSDFDGFIYDETHIMGAVMFNMFANELAHCYLRLGLTGSLPLDKQKREKILCRFGGDVMYKVESRKLMDEGFIARAKIQVHQTMHKIPGASKWLWEQEEDYYNKNMARLGAIAEFINRTANENALILTHPEQGAKLAELLGTDFIDGNISPAQRERYFEEFGKRRDYRLTASYGTVGTGISINDIFILYLIDVGKDYTRILQSIGRGCRLDTENRNEVIVHDISADTTHAVKHRRKRITVYKRKQYDYTEIPQRIIVP